MILLIPKTLEHNVFELTNDVLQGKVADAWRLYDDLLLYQQDQGDAIAAKIDALTAEINATAQTLDANADLANPKEYACPLRQR